MKVFALPCLVALLGAVLGAGCGDGPGPFEAARADRTLAHEAPRPHALGTTGREPADDYTLFEADPVRPVAVLAQSGLIAVANTVDDFVELVRSTPAGALSPCGGTRVGLRPVAVAVVKETPTVAELWVVNQLSDSISVIEVDTRVCSAQLLETLYLGDEPRDIVVSTTQDGRASAFVAAAHRGQHHPVESARSGLDLTQPAGEKQHPGLADVFVFDVAERALRGVVNLFTDTPRALAVGDGVVYAAGFLTGNRTTVLMGERVLERGLDTLRPLLVARGSSFVAENGELLLGEGVAGHAVMAGGMPAAVGQGRCLPDPRPDRADRAVAAICVQTDERQRIERVLIESPGVVHEACQCTSGDGTLQPTTSVIVQFHDSPAECGAAFATFPDGTQGCWLDAAPGGVASPAAHAGAQPAAMSWNDEVRFALPDRDVFAIGVDSLEVERAVSGVGTVVYGLAVQPGSGRVVAANTEALNLTRFEGAGNSASSSVQGHLHESHISIIDGTTVTAVHLNDHIDYSRCCAREPGENEQSLALPTSLSFSADGRQLYFTALGSDRVGILDASELGPGFHNARARERGALRDVKVGASEAEPAGPVGFAVDPTSGRLYVKTHFTNELVTIDPEAGEVVGRLLLATPEPPSITRGRPVLYDTRLTSAHGDSACASCHVFANFDGLAWDLGDPDLSTVKNPGPLAVSGAEISLPGVIIDPFSTRITERHVVEDFRSNKGPMATQTLRGMANHGAQHWRGDRTRRFQDIPPAQPNTGSLDENNSFNEFADAIVSLNGNDAALPPERFQDFADFALQLTLPPNPVRALDNTLDAARARARALYFGCASLTDEQLDARKCTALDGTLVDIDAETQACACSKNPLRLMLKDLPAVIAFLTELQPTLRSDALRARVVQAATTGIELPARQASELSQIGTRLDEAFLALGETQLELDEDALLVPRASDALSDLIAAWTELGHSGAELGVDLEARLYEALYEVLEPATQAAIPSSAALRSSFLLAADVGRGNAAVLADRAALGTAAYRGLIAGCSIQSDPTCRLRLTDTVTTCNGCHTLNTRGNAEFGVYRPGFFGTSGMYSFESESQILKIPHLRNAYTKVGMFGVSSNLFLSPNSVLGDRRGGFASLDGTFMGEQVRGFGFMHDGADDTLHHFFGGAVFGARPAGIVGAHDPGNQSAFETFLPVPEDRAACVAVFRSVSDERFEGMPPELAVCRNTSPLPDVCFLDPTSPACQSVLGELASQQADPAYAARFFGVRPDCFRMGSMLEGGVASGSCFPEGLRERSDMESFMLAFDTNLEPMVGQQLTLHAGALAPTPWLVSMLAVSARGGCDIAARQGAFGYLMTVPRAEDPAASELRDSADHGERLGALWQRDEPITLTCYPPHPARAEARRSAFSR